MGKTIDKIVVFDCETSGLNFAAGDLGSNELVCDGYQAVSWGMVISDVETFKPIAELYVEVKWNGESKWELKAEEVHGMSKEYLEKNGVTEEEALIEIVEFLNEHLDIKKPIYFMSHNGSSFDIWFLRQLFRKFEIKGLKVAHRHFDTFSLSMGTVMQHDSNDLFKKLGIKRSDTHNALEDAKATLESYRRIRKIWQTLMKKL